MRVRAWFLTGEPGIGKTTVLMKLIRMLRDRGYSVGGLVSREIRRGGERVAFEMIDLMTDERGILASKSLRYGPRVGRYRVDLESLERLSGSLIEAMRSCDVVICDEIGPMELYSPEFKRAVRELMSSGVPVIGVIHRRARDRLLDEIRGREDVKIVEVTRENREGLAIEIVKEVERVVEGGGRDR